MGTEGQSPRTVVPDRGSLSHNYNVNNRREKATSMPSEFMTDHMEQHQYEQLQKLQQHNTLAMFGVMGPMPQHPSMALGMIPLSPLLPSSSFCSNNTSGTIPHPSGTIPHPLSHSPLPHPSYCNNNTSSSGIVSHGVSHSPLPGPYCNNSNNNANANGIMPLSNFDFHNNHSTQSLRRMILNNSSHKVCPLNIPNHGAPPQPLPTTQHQYGAYLQEEQVQEGGIHHFGGEDNSKFPWMVPTVVIIHSLILVITMYKNDCPRTAVYPEKCLLRFLNRLSFEPLNENPLLGPSYKALLWMGALQSSLVTNAGQGWRLVTCMWLHAGLFHLIGNMVGLLSIGLRLERDFGWLKVITIYVMAGFGGSLLSALFIQDQISVGASGALMGLLGATVAEILINWTTYQNHIKSLAALFLAIAVNLSFGLMPHVDNFAHIGGLCAGMLLGFILLLRPQFAWVNQSDHHVDEQARSRLKHTQVQHVTWLLALGLLLMCYSSALVALFKGYGLDSRQKCKWCQYMSCVPSFMWQCGSDYS